MSSGQGVDLELSGQGQAENNALLVEPPLPISRILRLTAYFLAYGSTMSSMGLLVLPIESERMYPESYTAHLAMWLGMCGATQLVNPLVGYLSDRNPSKLGKRTPFIVAGGILSIIGALLAFYASMNVMPAFFAFSLVLSNLGCNIAYSGTLALLPDVIPDHQMGTASGLMGLFFIGGILFSFGVIGLCFPGDSVSYAYPFYVVVSIPCLIITCSAAQETPLVGAPMPIKTHEILASYVMTPKTHGDFFYATAMRFFYYMSIAIQSFGFFYLTDVVLECDTDTYHHPGSMFQNTTVAQEECHEGAKRGQAIASMMVGFAGVLCAAPAGIASDKIGRKKLVMLSTAMMTFVYLVMCLGPPLEVFYGISFIYGVGNGVFMTVEYALAVDVLPNIENKARDIGIWGVACFLGSTLGPATAQPLLEMLGSTPTHDRYTQSGFIAIFLLGGFYLICTALLIIPIKGSK